jgi:hypothetical protein
MAAATAVLTQSGFPKGLDMTQRRFYWVGTLAISASPATYPAGGFVLNPYTTLGNAPPQNDMFPGAVRGELDSRSVSGFVYVWTTKNLWIASHAYAVGQSIVDTNGNIQTVTTAGTSGASQPTWAIPTSATPNPTTVDNGATWTLQQPSCGLVQIFQSAGTAAPLVELAQAAAIPAGVSSDVISVKLEFLKT